MKFVKRLLVGSAVMVSLSLGGQLAPAGAQSVGAPQPVPGFPADENALLRSVSCGSATECVSIGATVVKDPEKPQFVVVRISGGRILPAKLYSGVGANDIACTTARDCIAVGGDKVLTFRDGAVQFPSSSVPGPKFMDLTSVSCWSASDCVAVGSALPEGAKLPTGIVVSMKDGVAQPPVAVPGVLTLTNVECRSSTCQSVGSPVPFSVAPGRSVTMAVSIVNGVPGEPVTVQGAGQNVLACPSTTTCFVPGAVDAPIPGTAPAPSASQSATVIPLVNGQPGAERTVATPGFFFRSMACESATRCAAIGPGAGPDLFSAVSFSDTEAGQSATYQGGNTVTYYEAACAGSAGCLAVGSKAKSPSKFSPSIVSLGFTLGAGTPGADVTTAPKAEGSSVSLGISCTASAGSSCALKGTLKARSGGRSVVVGTKNASVKDGRTATLKLTLNAKGKKLFAKSGQLAVTLAVTSTTGGKTKTVVTQKLTLKK